MEEWGSVLTFDTGDARMGGGQLPEDFAKSFSSRYNVALCSAGEHRIGSQMTEVRGQRGGTAVSRR
jgi:hypothetical protein